MRDKWLNQKLPQHALDRLDLLRLPSASLNPLPGLRPGLVERQQAALATTLDQLIRLCNELGTRSEQPWVCGFGLVQHRRDVLSLWEVERRELGGRVVGGRGRKRTGLDRRSTGEVVVEDGLAVGFEDGFGRHGEAGVEVCRALGDRSVNVVVK